MPTAGKYGEALSPTNPHTERPTRRLLDHGFTLPALGIRGAARVKRPFKNGWFGFSVRLGGHERVVSHLVDPRILG